MTDYTSDKNLKLFFWFHFFDSVCFISPVFSLFCLERGLTYPDLMTLLMVFVVSLFLSEVPTGAFADRFGLKTSFITGYSLRVTAWVILIFAHHKMIFFLAYAIYASGYSFFSGSDQAFVYETLKEAGREDEMSRRMGRILSARFVPPIAAMLIGSFIARDLKESQFVTLIVMGLCLNLVSFFILMGIKSPKSYEMNQEKRGIEHVKQGLRNIFTNKNLMLLFANECLVMIPTYVMTLEESLAQPYLVSSGLPVAMLGVVYSVLAIINSFSLNCIKFIEKYLSQKTIIHLTGLLILVAFLTGIIFSESVPVGIFIVYALFLSVLIRYSVFSEIKNMHIPSTSRATTLSLLSMVNCLFDVALIGSFIYFSSFGFKAIFKVCALFVFVGLWFPVRSAVNEKGNIKKQEEGGDNMTVGSND